MGGTVPPVQKVGGTSTPSPHTLRLCVYMIGSGNVAQRALQKLRHTSVELESATDDTGGSI